MQKLFLQLRIQYVFIYECICHLCEVVYWKKNVMPGIRVFQ